MKAAVILNKQSKVAGSESTADKIESGLKKYSINPEIFLVDKHNFKSIIDKIYESNVDLIVGAGGDGTINSAAELCIKKNIPLGVIPLGTFNHFAKDLNIPLELEDSLKTIGQKNIHLIDVGKINDNIFLNNSSIGLYPKAVKKRDQEIEKLGGKKYWAMWRAMLRIFKKFPIIEANIASKEKQMSCKTPFIFVGNNRYKMDLFNLGSRERINEGKLNIYYPNTSDKYSVFKFLLSALFNRLDQEKDFTTLESESIIVDIKKRKIEVAYDGEVVSMSPPLKYEILQKKLKVFLNDQD